MKTATVRQNGRRTEHNKVKYLVWEVVERGQLLAAFYGPCSLMAACAFAKGWNDGTIIDDTRQIRDEVLDEFGTDL